MPRNNPIDAKAVGRRLKTLRLELGLSQREFAVPGASYAYISRLEGGTRAPSWNALVLLAEHIRATANAEVAELIANDNGGTKVNAKWLAKLEKIAAETTALFLLTGVSDIICPLCERLPT